MATGEYVEGLEDRRDCNFSNDVDDTPELFLAASLQFLHRLLVQRRARCAQLDLDDALTTRERENLRRRNLNQQRQQDLMTDCRVYETKKSSDTESCDNVVTSTSSFDSSVPMHSFLNRNKLSDSVFERRNEYEAASVVTDDNQRKTSSNFARNFFRFPSLARSVVVAPPMRVVKSDEIRRRSFNENSVSGWKKNLSNKHEMKKKNSTQNTKVSNIDDHGVEKQTYQETKKKKRKRLTSFFFNLLKGKRTPSSISVSSTEDKPTSSRSFSTELTHNISENVLTTVRNDSSNDGSRDELIYMLKNNSKYSEMKFSELFCQIENNNKPNERSANCEPRNVDIQGNLTVNPTPRVTNCKTKSWDEEAAINVRREKEFVDDEASLEPEVEYDEEEIVEKCWENCTREKIVPSNFSECSYRVRKMCNSEIGQYDIDMFFNNAAARMRKAQMQYNRNANNNRVEIPVQIKTTETPLHLHKTRNSYSYYDCDCDCDCVSSSRENRIFEEGVINSQTTPANRIQTEELIRTFYRRLLEVESKPPEDSQQPINSEDSPLEVLLRHIAAASPIPFSKRPAADSEEDTIVQTSTTTPKRQLSKISVCCSSESLSNSDEELTGSGMNKYSTIDQDERKVPNHVLDNEPEPNFVVKNERASPEVRETEKTIFCSPVLTEKIHGEHKELADAMMRWWGPQISYSTTPSSQTQISTYSVSINNLM